MRLAIGAMLFFALCDRGTAEAAGGPTFAAPDGCVVEKVAGPPLVDYPLFACFDDQGRLYVAEGTGLNVPGPELVEKKLGHITRLEDTDGDGHFDTRVVFADKLIFPQGILWHDGVVYTASHPNVWRLEDTDGDGRADRREVLVGSFGFTGNGCDIHGPFLGPDGCLYLAEGRHGHDIRCPDGRHLKGLAARIFRFRTDGTEIERLAGGGFDNPVELVFTAEGEMIGTMDQSQGDQLLHYVEGGVYPQVEHPCVREFTRTGPPLGSIRGFSAAVPVALCGIERIRTAHFGPEYTGSLLTAQFNVHRLQQHVLTRDGATFVGSEKDFLVTLDYDVHPTDVLEDADGSLLMIDMGAWFNFGCPTSKIAKPAIKGTIYRIRRRDAPRIDDPWGVAIPWNELAPRRLVELLDDARVKVREKAIAGLAKRGPSAVPVLAEAIRAEKDGSLEKRRNALWALCRIRDAGARRAIREALALPETSLRHVALHSVALERDRQAMAALRSIVVSDEPPLRLKAAEALGRIGDGAAVPAILESLRRGATDRFLEHALIYALVRIDDREATLAALDDPSPAVRRAGLIALDQMKHGKLTRKLVAPLLDTDDPDLQQTALDVIARHSGWSDEIIDLLERWLAEGKLSEGQRRSLKGALIAFSRQARIQDLVAEAMAEGRTSRPMRLLLLEVMARCRLEAWPAAWQRPLAETLSGGDAGLVREAVATVRARNLTMFDPQLIALSRDATRPIELRVAALECAAPRMDRLPDDAFALLLAALDDEVPPLLRAAAARALGASRLDDRQRIRLAAAVERSGSLIVPLLVPAYRGSGSAEVGRALLAALKRSAGSRALSADDLSRLFDPYPAPVRAEAAPLIEKLHARRGRQAAYLTEVKLRLLRIEGEPERGRQVFFSKKAVCASCHRMGDRGGSVGPDLSHIGRLRSPVDLLESVLFPSSSIALGFEPYAIATRDGRVHSGIIVRQTSDAVYLRTAQLAEIRIPRGDIEELNRSDVSVMPAGLEKSLTDQQLSDLLEFLYRCR